MKIMTAAIFVLFLVASAASAQRLSNPNWVSLTNNSDQRVCIAIVWDSGSQRSGAKGWYCANPGEYIGPLVDTYRSSIWVAFSAADEVRQNDISPGTHRNTRYYFVPSVRFQGFKDFVTTNGRRGPGSDHDTPYSGHSFFQFQSTNNYRIILN